MVTFGQKWVGMHITKLNLSNLVKLLGCPPRIQFCVLLILVGGELASTEEANQNVNREGRTCFNGVGAISLENLKQPIGNGCSLQTWSQSWTVTDLAFSQKFSLGKWKQVLLMIYIENSFSFTLTHFSPSPDNTFHDFLSTDKFFQLLAVFS